MMKKSNLSIASGITLVALVVTIVVLLILAGITLTFVLGDNSVFNQASKAKEQTAIAKAREKLEIVLSEAKILKYSDPKYKQDEYLYLNEMILNKISESKVNGDVAIVDGYAFTLDRSIPWIGVYAGKEEELIFPELTTSVTISTDKKTVTITITAKEEKNGIKKIEVLQDGIVIKPYNYENRKDEITETYTITRNGKYIIKATAVLTTNKIENITDLVSSVQYTPNGNATWKKEHQVKVTAIENVDKVESIKYQWTDSTVEPAANTFNKTIESETVIENTLTGKYYLWTLLEDSDGNTRIEKSEAFWFDNTVPTADLTTEWIEEENRNRLKITLINAQDNDSGFNENVEVYITPENGTKEEKNIKLANDSGEIIIDGLNRESITKIKVELKDKAGNKIEIQKNTGRLYAVKNGKIIRGKPLMRYSTSFVGEKDGLMWMTLVSPTNTFNSCYLVFSAPAGSGTFNVSWKDSYRTGGYWDYNVYVGIMTDVTIPESSSSIAEGTWISSIGGWNSNLPKENSAQSEFVLDRDSTMYFATSHGKFRDNAFEVGIGYDNVFLDY